MTRKIIATVVLALLGLIVVNETSADPIRSPKGRPTGRGLTVRGKVTTPDGKPAVGVDVIEIGRWVLDSDIPAARATSTERGEYVLPGLPEDKVRTLMVCDVRRQLKALVRVPDAKLRAKPDQAVVDIVLSPTARIVAKIAVPKKARSDVHVQLWEAFASDEGNYEDRQPVDLFVTTRKDRDGSYDREQLPLAPEPTLDANGNLTVPYLLPNWKYELRIYGEGVVERRISDIQLGAEEVRNLGTIEVDRARDLELTIVDTTGKPLSDVSVAYRPVVPPAKVVVSPDNDSAAPAAGANDGRPGRNEPRFMTFYMRSDKDGKIVLSQVPDCELIVKPVGISTPRKPKALEPNEAPAPEPIVWPTTLPPAAETKVPGGVPAAKIVINTVALSKR